VGARARPGEAPTRARLVALRVLERVDRGGAYANLALHAALARAELVPGDRALATELVYGTLRWRGHLDFLLAAVCDRPLESLQPVVLSLLRLGAYQIRRLDRIPDSAAVDQSVRLARAAGVERAAGLANAVLRRLCREGDDLNPPSLDTDPVGHLRDALSLPEWIAERWVARYGAEDAAALARASNEPAPLTVRTNLRRVSAADLLSELRERSPEARPTEFAEGGISLGHHGDPGQDPALLEGRFTIQDEGSQLVVAALDPQPGERILDLCAAPGAKSTAIAERIGETGEVIAVDRNGRRLGLLGREARRLGLRNITTRELDASNPLPESLAGGAFDRVLVDAPCSGLGTLRRNPDARWRLMPEDLSSLAQTQQRLLRSAATALRPGGVLVYSTCTLAPEENEAVIHGFLAESPDFALCQKPDWPPRTQPLVEDGFLRCFPHRHHTDGFTAARLERLR